MSVTVELPKALQKRLEQIAEECGVSVEELLVNAAEKLSEFDTLEKIKKGAERRNTRPGFERYLAASPDIEPIPKGDIVK